jgi:hypothetical protein
LTLAFRLVPAIACCSALMLAGCGGASSPATTGTGASGPSGDGPFFAEANAVCRAAQKTGSVLPQPHNETELAPFLERAQMLGQDEVNKLSALHPPSDKAAAYRIWLGSLNQTLGELRAAIIAAKAHKTAEVDALVREGGGLTQRNLTRAAEVGLTACAKEG